MRTCRRDDIACLDRPLGTNVSQRDRRRLPATAYSVLRPAARRSVDAGPGVLDRGHGELEDGPAKPPARTDSRSGPRTPVAKEPRGPLLTLITPAAHWSTN